MDVSAEDPPHHPPLPNAMLDRDQPCMKCGYQLRGLPVAGVCPECGTPVQDSLRGLLLQYASEEYRRRMLRGLSLVLNSIMLMVIVKVVFSRVLMAAFGQPPGVALGVTIASLGVTAMSIVGYWWYTELDPGYTGVEKPKSARRVARVAVCVSAGIQAVELILQLAESAVAPVGGTAAGLSALTVVSVGLTLAGLAAWGTQFFATMAYTRWVGTRLPDAFVQRRAKKYMWLLPLLQTVGIIALGLGPVVALVLYWNLLDRVRKHLRSINTAGVPADLPGTFG